MSKLDHSGLFVDDNEIAACRNKPKDISWYLVLVPPRVVDSESNALAELVNDERAPSAYYPPEHPFNEILTLYPNDSPKESVISFTQVLWQIPKGMLDGIVRFCSAKLVKLKFYP
jgi:hypothetical protein